MMSRWRRSATDERRARPSSRAHGDPASAGRPPRSASPARPARRLGDFLLIAGGLVLAYPLWSAAYAQVQQTRLDAAYRTDSARAVLVAPDNSSGSTVPEREVIRRLAVTYAQGLEKGDAVGRLQIPRLALDRLVQEGESGPAALDANSDRALLRNGPVHYATTPLPGAGEPFAIAGHRTTYGAPFFKLDKLQRGDVIFVETPYARFRYSVVKKTVVEPTDVSVLLDRGYGLVLTTCTPPFSASERLIVWASLKAATPKRGAPSGPH